MVQLSSAQWYRRNADPITEPHSQQANVPGSDSSVLVSRIDHLSCSYNTIEEVDSLMRIFGELLGLPRWFPAAVCNFTSPAGFSNYGTGVYLGNVFLEFVTFDTRYPGVGPKTYSPYDHGMAFVNDIADTKNELDRRGVSRGPVYHYAYRNADQTVDTLFTTIQVSGLSTQPIQLFAFFCEYHLELFDCD
jgi:hypothetical protein